MKFIHSLLPVISIMLAPCNTIAQNKETDHITWHIASQLPLNKGMEKQLGVAGVFTGVSNNVLLIAGGSNFADGAKPWQGGKKLHLDNIYVLEKTAGNKFSWLAPKTNHLKQKAAYGASTTMPEGVICAGGETETANSSKNVFIMRWDAALQDVVFNNLPSLPIPLANACMTSIGRVLYLFGGESNGKPSAKVFMLNLDDRGMGWLPCPPLPVAMSHSVAVVQSNGYYPCIYIIGGRSNTPSGISTLHNSAFCYDPKFKTWIALNVVGGEHPTTISAATGVAYGDHQILLIGGDKGDLFHKIETWNATIATSKNEEVKQQANKEKLALLNNHPGFSRDVYSFNTLTYAWHKIGELPFYGQVTTTAVKWDGAIFIPCGEIKPGIRTADVTMGEFDDKK